VTVLPFPNREHAGRLLAGAIIDSRIALDHPLVLAVPRGGVLVAAPIAAVTDGEMDVVVVRKIGAPQNPELGLGAVGAEGQAVLDRHLIDSLRVPESYVRAEIERQRGEVARRLREYRGDKPVPSVAGRDVIVVDDGIATGGTVAAAGRILKSAGPRTLILAVAVAPAESLARLGDTYDRVVCQATPEPFYAVGQWYEDFHQVTDDEVRDLLMVR
jgi:putative phosphoribosyl transferase